MLRRKNVKSTSIPVNGVASQKIYDYLKESGYEVKPLGRGNFRDIPYEDGGGFRIHWDGDRILSYHSAERSHHNGAYFKVSSGKSGVIRIYLDT